MDLDYLRLREKAETDRAALASDSTLIIAHLALARAYRSRISEMESATMQEATA